MLNYCNALSSVVFTKMVRLNTIMLIFYQLFPRCCHRRLVVVVIVGISLSLLAYHLRCRRLFVVAVVVFLLSFLASRHHLCIVHGGGGVPPHGWFLRLCRLVVVVVISVSSFSLAMCCSRRQRCTLSWLHLLDLAPLHCCRCRRHLVVVSVSLFSAAASLLVDASIRFCASLPLSSPLGILLLEASCCCCHRRLLVVVVVGGVLSLSSAVALRSYLKILAYIRLTMHTTTMEPKHQV